LSVVFFEWHAWATSAVSFLLFFLLLLDNFESVCTLVNIRKRKEEEAYVERIARERKKRRHCREEAG